MRKNERPIYVKDIIELYDYDGTMNLPVIIDESDGVESRMYTGSVALDMLEDLEVCALSIKSAGTLGICITDASLAKYWDNKFKKGESNE